MTSNLQPRSRLLSWSIGLVVVGLGLAGFAANALAAALPASNAAWTVSGAADSNWLGFATAAAGDFNGDGFDDAVVSAPASDGQRGMVRVYYGSASGPAATPDWSQSGSQTNDALGYSVGTAGDVNNDGFDDLVVGTGDFIGTKQDPGKAFLYLGSAGGLGGVADWYRTGTDNDDLYGLCVSGAGDVNNDGYDDVLVGSPGYPAGQNTGRALLYLGSASGLGAAAWVADGEASNNFFGVSVAAAGDVNDDGYGDVLVGAGGYAKSRGKAYLYLGNAAGLESGAAWTAMGETNAHEFGQALAGVGDVTGDGYADVAVGAPGFYINSDMIKCCRGKTYVYYGGPAGLLAAPSWSVYGQDNFEFFASAVSSGRDLNGDGFGDLLVGAYGYNYGHDKGKAYLYLGRAAGFPASANWTVTGGLDDDQFANAMAAGDVNGDGLGDVLVGARYAPAGGVRRGAAYLYPGVSLDQPQAGVIGTNGLLLASGIPASAAAGTHFGTVPLGAWVTNRLALTNSGTAVLLVHGCATTGVATAQFRVAGMPPAVAPHAVGVFTVAFHAAAPGDAQAALQIANNTVGGLSNYVVNLRGVVEKLDQTIAFPLLPNPCVTGSVILAAAASSGLPVALAVLSGPGTISGGSNLAFNGVGDVLITASQPGNATWNPAPDVTNHLHVYRISPQSGPFAGGNRVALTNGTLGSGADITNVTVGGLAAAIFEQNASAITVTMPAFGSAGPKTVVVQSASLGETIFADAYEAESPIPAGGLGLGTNALDFSATYRGAAPLPQSISLANVGGQALGYTNRVSYGTPAADWLAVAPAAGQLAAGGATGLTHSVASAQLDAGVYTATNTVASAEATNSPQHIAVRLTINPADQTIDFPAVAPQNATGAVALAAAASSGLPVSLAVLSGPGIISAGSNLAFTGAGDVVVVANQPGDANWNPAPGVTNRVHAYAVTPAAGPFAGGNLVVLTNGMLGSGGDITDVTLGGAAAAIVDQGANWVSFLAPGTGSAGRKDIVVDSASVGTLTFGQAYAVNPAGVIGWDVDDYGQWLPVAGLPQGGIGFAAAVLNGKIYVMGDSAITTNVYQFDGSAWIEVAGMPAGKYMLAAAVLDGALYAIGGYQALGSSTNVFRFDGTAWSEVAGLPVPRHGLVAATLDNALYAIGGLGPAGACSNVFRFDGAAWSEVAGLPAPRAELAAATFQSAIYAIGGSLSSMAHSNVYRFDGTAWSEAPPLPIPCKNLAAAGLGSNLYAMGASWQTNVYRFDGAVWTKSVPMPEAFSGGAACALDGALYTLLSGHPTNVVPALRFPGKSWFPGVSPASGSRVGGYPVAINGLNLGSGADVTNVTLCNVPAAVTSQNPTQVVVTAGAAATPIAGDVVVYSIGYGIITATNAFTYLAPEPAPQVITFPPIGPQRLTNVVTLVATASSGLPVAFAVAGGPGVITNGIQLSFTGLGVVAVAAAQPGNNDWLPAPNETNLVTVINGLVTAPWELLLREE